MNVCEVDLHNVLNILKMVEIIKCVWKVAVFLGYGRVQLKCDGTR